MGNILIVAELTNDGTIRDASYELVALARKLAEDSGRGTRGLVIGNDIGDTAAEFASRGAGETLDADLVLISNTPTGWDVAPRVAAGLDAAYLSDCFNIEASGDDLTFFRRIFNGKLDAELTAQGTTIVTIQPGATDPYEGSGEAGTAALELSLDGLRTQFVETKQAESTGVDLSKADIIVSGGRGVGAPEKFTEVIQPLAEALGGAMGASRPVVDAGWLDHPYQVGSSGQIVSPKLYIACGISGAIQHLVGMKGSNYVIAVNKDPDAPIFEVADVGVVADLFDVIPALTSAVQEAKG